MNIVSIDKRKELDKILNLIFKMDWLFMLDQWWGSSIIDTPAFTWSKAIIIDSFISALLSNSGSVNALKQVWPNALLSPFSALFDMDSFYCFTSSADNFGEAVQC